MSLSVQIPVTITDAMLTSSTVAETDYAAWSAATTYIVGDRVISTTTHRIYESAAASNLNHDPTLIANRTGTTIWWIDVAPTNRWAMFDSVNNTQTSSASPIIVVVAPGAVNSVYFGNLTASSVQVVLRDTAGGTIVYDTGLIYLDSSPPDYYEYFFDPFVDLRSYIVDNLAVYSTAEITVTISESSGNAKCGILSFGDTKALGRPLTGAIAKPKTYSYINTDTFGNTTIVRRKATTDMSVSAVGEISDAGAVLETIQSVLDVPCAWIANDQCALYTSLAVFGLGSGDLTFTDSTKYHLSLNIQGLI